MTDFSINGQDAVTLRDNERKLHALYVTAERQKWRERIRELVIETVGIAAQTRSLQPYEIRELHVIRAELEVRLNLSDANDKKIIKHIDDIITEENDHTKRLDYVKNFEDEVSWLLKEDWERVKHETRPLWLWLCSERKVDRTNKFVKSLSCAERWKAELWKFFSFLLSVAILVGVLSFTIVAIGCAYQWVQLKEPKKVEVSKETKEEQTPKCNAPLAPLPQPTTASESALPIQITVAPVITNELSNDDNVTTPKNSRKGSNRGWYCKK